MVFMLRMDLLEGPLVFDRQVCGRFGVWGDGDLFFSRVVCDGWVGVVPATYTSYKKVCLDKGVGVA